MKRVRDWVIPIAWAGMFYLSGCAGDDFPAPIGTTGTTTTGTTSGDLTTGLDTSGGSTTLGTTGLTGGIGTTETGGLPTTGTNPPPTGSTTVGIPVGDENTLVLGSHTISRSQITPVPIQLIQPTNVAGIQARLLYYAGLFEVINPAGTEFEGTAGAGSILQIAGFTINYEPNRPVEGGKKGVAFAISQPTGTNTGGKLVTLYFRAKSDALLGATAPFELDPAFQFVIAREDGMAAPPQHRAGVLTVGP